MELVEFMSNKECVVETFKVNGLIAKDNTVTEKGLINGYTVLFRYDRAKEARIRKLSNGLYVM